MTETPLQFGLRVARDWYSGGHGDLAHLIAREVERREASPQATAMVVREGDRLILERTYRHGEETVTTRDEMASWIDVSWWAGLVVFSVPILTCLFIAALVCFPYAAYRQLRGPRRERGTRCPPDPFGAPKNVPNALPDATKGSQP